MSTRRGLLARVGATAVGTGLAVLALPAPPAEPDPEVYETVALPESWMEVSIEDEESSPVARYQYRPSGEVFEATAPINVVALPGSQDEPLAPVARVLRDAGWHRTPEEYTRFAWDRREGRYVRQELTAAETYYGLAGRFHVRCWAFEGVVSIQAHEDTEPTPRHGIASYERGREYVRSLFLEAGWAAGASRIDLTNEGGVDHDGKATVLLEDP